MRPKVVIRDRQYLNPSDDLAVARYVAFLRGINLGKRRVKMTDLAFCFEELGFREVATFIASGNVVFETSSTPSQVLEGRISRHLEKKLGYAVDTFVRSAAEIVEVLAALPFRPAELAGNTLHVGFMQEDLQPEVVKKLRLCGTPVDVFEGKGKEIYWLCRIRTSESKVWSSPNIKALKLPSMTMRNLTSLQKLADVHIFGGVAPPKS